MKQVFALVVTLATAMTLSSSAFALEATIKESAKAEVIKAVGARSASEAVIAIRHMNKGQLTALNAKLSADGQRLTSYVNQSPSDATAQTLMVSAASTGVTTTAAAQGQKLDGSNDPILRCGIDVADIAKLPTHQAGANGKAFENITAEDWKKDILSGRLNGGHCGEGQTFQTELTDEQKLNAAYILKDEDAVCATGEEPHSCLKKAAIDVFGYTGPTADADGDARATQLEQACAFLKAPVAAR